MSFVAGVRLQSILLLLLAQPPRAARLAVVHACRVRHGSAGPRCRAADRVRKRPRRSSIASAVRRLRPRPRRRPGPRSAPPPPVPIETLPPLTGALPTVTGDQSAAAEAATPAGRAKLHKCRRCSPTHRSSARSRAASACRRRRGDAGRARRAGCRACRARRRRVGRSELDETLLRCAPTAPAPTALSTRASRRPGRPRWCRSPPSAAGVPPLLRGERRPLQDNPELGELADAHGWVRVPPEGDGGGGGGGGGGGRDAAAAARGASLLILRPGRHRGRRRGIDVTRGRGHGERATSSWGAPPDGTAAAVEGAEGRRGRRGRRARLRRSDRRPHGLRPAQPGPGPAARAAAAADEALPDAPNRRTWRPSTSSFARSEAGAPRAAAA